MKILSPISILPKWLGSLLFIVFACQYLTVAKAQDGNARNAECRGRCGSSVDGSGSRSSGKPSNSGSDAAALMSLGQGLLELSQQQKAREARENSAVLDNNSAGVNTSGTPLSKRQPGELNCKHCHTKEKKLVGPSWNDISNRYSASQLDLLAKTARYGNKGNTNWGAVHCAGDASLSEYDAKTLVSLSTGIWPKANSSPPSNNSSIQQTGNCRQNLAHLSSRIPSFSAPEISGLRALLLETDIRQTISAAKQQGYGPNQAVDASFQQARENDRVARQGAECASDVDAWGTTDEAFYQSISAGRIDRQINCQSSIRNSCLCAAIVNKMTAVGSRAIAAEMQCYIKNNRW